MAPDEPRLTRALRQAAAEVSDVGVPWCLVGGLALIEERGFARSKALEAEFAALLLELDVHLEG